MAIDIEQFVAVLLFDFEGLTVVEQSSEGSILTGTSESSTWSTQ